MSNFIDQKIKLAIDGAEKLLNKYEISIAPVDVEKIAGDMGIEVSRMKFSKDEISGAIKIKGKSGNPAIAVNEDHCKERQRFTIAHEIGHFILHSIDNFHIDSTEAVYFRDANATSSTTNIKEVQANQFAAELLMPKSMIVSDLQGGYKLNNSDDDVQIIARLAKKYNVSSQAMSKRIGNLVA
ncbi:MAG: ImmA/IrrE family metallo-endopeptidase [Candidatus Falkowbacteria bacterium]|nr:ImmA/IrrE family metallo-endopeptidase [Candidatus Falkowbacteria bacterium]